MELSTKTDSLDYQARVLLVLTTPNVLHNADEIRELCKRYPQEPEPAYLMAVVHKELGELDQAYTQIIKAASQTTKVSHMQHKYITNYEIPYLFADICIQQKNYRAAEKVIKMRVAEKVTDWFGKHSSFLANAAMQLLQPSADYRFCLAISYGVLKTSATRSMRGNTTP